MMSMFPYPGLRARLNAMRRTSSSGAKHTQISF